MGRTRITIVRHGETEWNVLLKLQGQLDSELTPLGLDQARAAARILQYRKFDKLIVSDLPRVINTTKEINAYHNLELNLEPGLRERNFGIMESMTRDQVKVKFPETYEGYMTRNPEYQVPEGESLIQFYNRVINTYDKIAVENEGLSVLTVAHGGVLDCIIRRVFNMKLDEPRKYRLYNGSINAITVQDGIWMLDEWGTIDHGDDIKPKDELATLEVQRAKQG